MLKAFCAKSILNIGLLFWVINTSAQSSYGAKLDSLFNTGYEFMYTNKNISYESFEKVQKLATTHKDWESVSDALMGAITISDYYNDFSKVKINLDKLDSLFIRQKNHFNQKSEFILYKNLFSYHKGNYYYNLRNFNKSRAIFNDIIKNTENLPDSLLQGNFINNISYMSLAYTLIARMYSEEGKLDFALDNYTKNIRFISDKNPSSKDILNGNYALIAEVYKKKKEYEKANSYLLKSLEHNVKKKTNSSLLSLLNIVQNHNYLHQIDSANYYLKIAKNQLHKEDPNLSNYFQVEAEVAKANDKYSASLLSFNKALDLIKTKWSPNNHWEVAYVLNKIGLLHDHFNNPIDAINAYDLAIKELSSIHTENANTTLITILKNKASALNKIKNNKNTLETVDIGIKILDTLKPSFKNTRDKLFLLENAYPLFESGLKAAYNQYTSTKDESFIGKAFFYSEKSKSAILLDALLAANATKFSNIPSKLLEKESILKSQITIVKKKLDNSANPNTTLADELFNLEKEYYQLTNTFEKEYPAYYNLRYNNSTISLHEVQENLQRKELFISYFYGEKAIYSIVLTKNTKQFYSLPVNSSLEKDINSFYQMVSTRNSNLNDLNQLSNQLYQQLIAPALTDKSIEKLLIIPDGLLNYIPFDALNSEQNKVRYLIQDYAVSTINSATLLHQMQQKKNNKNTLLAFAPKFDGEVVVGKTIRSGLAPLPNNENEVNRIISTFSGDSFLGTEASLSNFNNNVANHNVIHLATHAVFNDSVPEYSYLAFTPKDTTDYVLYTSDIYNLNVDADLVTLSACETGKGTLKKGEGAISLSRAFFYSGARSIVSTLWNIIDNSAATIMTHFYANLSKGDAKDVALQKAKLTYLKKYKETKLTHPYYWAAFTIQGNVTALNASSWQWLLLGSIAIIILFLGSKKLFQGVK